MKTNRKEIALTGINKKNKRRILIALLLLAIICCVTAEGTSSYASSHGSKKLRSVNFNCCKTQHTRTVPGTKHYHTETVPDTVHDPVGSDQTEVAEVTGQDPTNQGPAEMVPGTKYDKMQVYYVSQAGSDSNCGTAELPFRTIQKAANTAKAGDTVYIRGGTYREKVVVKNSGAKGDFITFSGYPGEEVVLDGSGVKLDYFIPLFSVGSQSYIKIQGIKVTNSAGQGIGDANGAVNNGHIIIEDCSTYRTQISGVHFYKAHHIVIDGVFIDTANLTADQEALTLAGVTDFEIKNCTVINAQKECIDVKDGCRNGKIYNNTVKDARLKSGLAIYVDGSKSGCSNIELYNNTIDNCIQGIVIASELGGKVADINIHHNDINDCQQGIQIADWGYIPNGTYPMDNIAIHNNNMSGKMGTDLILGNPDARNVVIKNNVLGGTMKTVPIIFKGGNPSETLIDENALIRIINGYPTGTNYTLIEQ